MIESIKSMKRTYREGTSSLARATGSQRRPALNVFAALKGLLLTLLLFSLGGCQNGGTLPNPAGAFTPGLLAAGDIVKLSFTGAPEMNQAQKIRSDGKISLPLIGEVQAAGKKLKALQEELTGLYKPQLKVPEVVVTLESSTISVNVTGEVLKPGKVALDRPLTLLEAIMEAGGVTLEGSLKDVLVIRNVDGKQYTQYFDLSPAFRGKTTSSFYLRPYDMIVVSESSLF